MTQRGSMKKQFAFAVGAFLGAVTAFAQEATPAPWGSEAVAAVTKWIDAIPTEGTWVLIGAGVVDLVLRLWKSEKPRSVLHAIAGMMMAIGTGVMKLATLLDKVLPQRLK